MLHKKSGQQQNARGISCLTLRLMAAINEMHLPARCCNQTLKE
jgi:hypothetical protein